MLRPNKQQQPSEGFTSGPNKIERKLMKSFENNSSTMGPNFIIRGAVASRLSNNYVNRIPRN